MSILELIVLSIVQGVTEFLPISSTGHLYIFSNILKIENSLRLSTFIISIQIGAIIAGFLFLIKTIKITKDLIKKVFCAFLPTVILGFIFYDFVKNFLQGNLFIIAIALIVGGILILLVDKNAPSRSISSGPRVSSGDAEEILRDSAVKQLSYKDAFILGVVQALSFIPGVSRSGSIIIGGKLLNYNRKEIVVFTFLLGLPVMFSATVYDVYKTINLWDAKLLNDIILGIIVSGIVAYIVARWFLKYVTNNNFKIFGYYRIVVGILLLMFLV